MKNSFGIILSLFLLPSVLLTQTGVVRGKIIDELGLGMPGANVYFEDYPASAITDVNGVYTIVNAPI